MPMGHCTQGTYPSAEKVPGGQVDTQSEGCDDPVVIVMDPFAQAVHVTAPATSAYVLSGQALQGSDPVDELKPGWQRAEQLLTDVAPLIALLSPGGQTTQDVC